MLAWLTSLPIEREHTDHDAETGNHGVPYYWGGSPGHAVETGVRRTEAKKHRGTAAPWDRATGVNNENRSALGEARHRNDRPEVTHQVSPQDEKGPRDQ